MYQKYSSEKLFDFLECLGFRADSFVGDDTDQIKFVHDTVDRVGSRRNWINVPNFKVFSKKLIEKIMEDVNNFNFSFEDLQRCSNY